MTTDADDRTSADVPSATTGQAQRDAELFVTELEALREADTGRFASLKRNAGETLPGRGTVWFYDYLTNPGPGGQRSIRIRQWNAELYFLVATIYAQFDWKRTVATGGDFGRTLAELARRMSSEPGDAALRRFRRFHILLDAEFDTIVDPSNEDARWQAGGGEMSYRMRQMVRLLASKGLGPNWPQLLVDLCQWGRPDRRIQKKWARSYFGAPDTTPDTPDEQLHDTTL